MDAAYTWTFTVVFFYHMVKPVREIPWAPIGSFSVGILQYDHFHENGSSVVLLLCSKVGKFKICYQNYEKKINIVILNSETTRKSLKD